MTDNAVIRMRQPGSNLLAIAILGLAAVAVYGNSFGGAFVFDDRYWIVDNPSIRHLWPIGQLLWPADFGVVGGRPVVSLTLAVNYALGGTNVWGYHAANLAIHLLAACTLFGSCGGRCSCHYSKSRSVRPPRRWPWPWRCCGWFIPFRPRP